MKTSRNLISKTLSSSFLVIASYAILNTSATAAVILWHDPVVTALANDGDALNNFSQLGYGTFHEGGHFDYTSSGADGSGAVTVNDTFRNRTLVFTDVISDAANQLGDASPDTGNTQFDQILTFAHNGEGGSTLTLGGVNPLTPGTRYAIQFFGHSGSTKTLNDGTITTTLTGQPGGDEPWFVTGSFVADGPTQTLISSRGAFAAYLLTEQAFVIPEPSALGLLGLGVVILLRGRRRTMLK